MAVKLRFVLVAAILHGAITTLLPVSPYPPANAASFVVVTGQVLQPFRLRCAPPLENSCLAAAREAVQRTQHVALCSSAPLHMTIGSCRAWACKTGRGLRPGSLSGQPCVLLSSLNSRREFAVGSCRQAATQGSLASRAQSDDPKEDGSAPTTWTIRRGGEVIEIPASNRKEGGIPRGQGGGHRPQTDGRDDGMGRRRQWRGPGSLHRGNQRGGRGGGNRRQYHEGRPMPAQVMLNQRIVASTSVSAVFSEVAGACEKGIPLNSVNLATALHRVARCGNAQVFDKLLHNEDYLYLINEVITRLESDKSDDFKPREIANTAWGVAKAQVTVPKLFANLCRAAVNFGLENFKPQELSNCVWACSTSCNHYSCTSAQRAEFQTFLPDFFQRVEAEIVRRSPLKAGAPTSNAPTSDPDAYAHSSFKAPQPQGLSDFKPQELSNTLWSFATLACDHVDVFKVIEQEMLSRGLDGYVAQTLPSLSGPTANSAHIFIFIFIICTHHTLILVLICRYVAQDIANSVWAFVTAGTSTEQVLALVEQDVTRRGVECFKSQELANLVWAFAKADYPMTTLLDLTQADVLKRDLAGTSFDF